MNSEIPLRVGYWWSQKKSRKFKYEEFAEVCRSFGIELRKLDFEIPLEEQGHFHAIVHKLSNSLLQARGGDTEAQHICQKFQDYVASHPEIVVIDPLEKVECLLDRYSQYSLLQFDKSHQINKEMDDDIFIPAFVELLNTDINDNLRKMKSAGIKFPIVCKPSLAHGSPSAHEMCIVFSEAGLADIQPPCVVQEFVNHNAVLHKMFIIGDTHFVTRRPSLKNFSAGDQPTIYFNSHLVSKAHSVSELCEMDDSEQSPKASPNPDTMSRIAEMLRQRMCLTLLGADVIVHNGTGRHAVIDINPFPGYDEVDNFFELLCDLIKKKVSQKTACLKNSDNLLITSFNMQEPQSSRCCPLSSDHVIETISPPPHRSDCLQEDSGIETSDSCDEKKKPTTSFRAKRQHSKNSNNALCSMVKESNRGIGKDVLPM